MPIIPNNIRDEYKDRAAKAFAINSKKNHEIARQLVYTRLLTTRGRQWINDNRAAYQAELDAIDEKIKKEIVSEHSETFFPGDQIAYIPSHANGDIHHPDCEYGFVTKDVGNNGVFCRYFRKLGSAELRTVANSELTPRENLVKFESVLQGVVDQLLAGLQS